jgi:hypothetical protein
VEGNREFWILDFGFWIWAGLKALPFSRKGAKGLSFVVGGSWLVVYSFYEQLTTNNEQRTSENEQGKLNERKKTAF